MWTDPGRFIHQLDVRICLSFSTLYSSSFTIAFAELNKPSSQRSTPSLLRGGGPPPNVFEIFKLPPGA